METAEKVQDVDGVKVPVRTTWVPVFRKGKIKGAANKSHVGGRPLLPPGVERPRCGHCQVPMPLLIQIHADDDPRPAPHALPANSVLQVFWCAGDCVLGDDSWGEDASTCLAQLEILDERTAKAVAPHSGRSEPKRIIEDWQASATLPHYLDDILETLTADDDWREDYIGRDLEPDDSTRLGGFPWLCSDAGDVHAICPDCESPMAFELQLQLETFRTVGWFGNAWVMRCPEHPESVAIRFGRDG